MTFDDIIDIAFFSCGLASLCCYFIITSGY